MNNLLLAAAGLAEMTPADERAFWRAIFWSLAIWPVLAVLAGVVGVCIGVAIWARWCDR
jgi:hypothetical protein